VDKSVNVRVMETKSAVAGGAAVLLALGVFGGLIATANAQTATDPVVSVTTSAPATTAAPTPTPEPVVTTATPEPVAVVVTTEAPAPVYVAPEPAPVYVAPTEIQSYVIAPPAPPAAGTDPNWIPAPRVAPTVAPPLRPFGMPGQPEH
jgi:hypothetical protein